MPAPTVRPPKAGDSIVFTDFGRERFPAKVTVVREGTGNPLVDLVYEAEVVAVDEETGDSQTERITKTAEKIPYDPSGSVDSWRYPEEA